VSAEPGAGHTVVYNRTPRALTKQSGASVWNRRDADFGRNFELAYRQQLPVRVIVVDGKRPEQDDPKPKASRVKARLLDSVAWAVAQYNSETGEALLVRGRAPVGTPVESADLALSWFEGERKQSFIYHRRREAEVRRRKIEDVRIRNHGKLICEVPNCGFDFAKRYGTLGEGYAQVHHLLPLREAPDGGRPTKLEDLAIVCANCHVMIHLGGECRPFDGLIRKSPLDRLADEALDDLRDGLAREL
jgi:5-methylcytosine-specific restriction protein A